MNARMKNFCKQKDIDLIEHRLRTKKLYFKYKGNSVFAKNIYLIES